MLAQAQKKLEHLKALKMLETVASELYGGVSTKKTPPLLTGVVIAFGLPGV